jgi:hypothetical protein
LPRKLWRGLGIGLELLVGRFADVPARRLAQAAGAAMPLAGFMLLWGAQSDGQLRSGPLNARSAEASCV